MIEKIFLLILISNIGLAQSPPWQTVGIVLLNDTLKSDSIYTIDNEFFVLETGCLVNQFLINNICDDKNIKIDFDNYGVADRLIIRNLDSIIIVDTKWIGSHPVTSPYPFSTNTLFFYQENEVTSNLNNIPENYTIETNNQITGKGSIILENINIGTYIMEIWSYPRHHSSMQFKINYYNNKCENKIERYYNTYSCIGNNITQYNNISYGECCDTVNIITRYPIYYIWQNEHLYSCDEEEVYYFPTLNDDLLENYYFLYNETLYNAGDSVYIYSYYDNEIEILYGNCSYVYNAYLYTYETSYYYLDTILNYGTFLGIGFNLPGYNNSYEDYSYIGSIIDNNGCKKFVNITIKYTSNNYYVPNAISPNNDNLNDCLEIYGNSLINNWEIEVYDRWGGLLFKGDKGEAWCPNTTNNNIYVIVAKVYYNNNFEIYRGIVNILK